MPIINYFAETLRFNPTELDALKPDLTLISVNGNREEVAPQHTYYDDFEKIKSVSYLYYGVEFRTEYYTRSDKFRTIVPAQSSTGRVFLGDSDAAVTLLDAVQFAAKSYEEESFRIYLSWLVNNAFSAPYSYRQVDIVEKDQEEKVAKVLVDGFVKMVVAYRFRQKNKYIMRIAGPEGLVKLEHPSLTGIGREMRLIVARRYREASQAPSPKAKGRLSNLPD